MSTGDIVALGWGVIVGILFFYMAVRSKEKDNTGKDEERGDKKTGIEPDPSRLKTKSENPPEE